MNNQKSTTYKDKSNRTIAESDRIANVMQLSMMQNRLSDLEKLNQNGGLDEKGIDELEQLKININLFETESKEPEPKEKEKEKEVEPITLKSKKKKKKKKEKDPHHENSMGTFNNFPDEILVGISEFLKTPGQLGIFAQLNKACNRIVQTNLTNLKNNKSNYLNMQFDFDGEVYCFAEGKQYAGNLDEASDTITWGHRDETDSVKIKMYLSENNFQLLLLEDGTILGRTLKDGSYFPAGLQPTYNDEVQWQKIHPKDEKPEETTEKTEEELQWEAAGKLFSDYDSTSAADYAREYGSPQIDDEVDSLQLPLITQIAACEMHLLALSEHGDLYTLGEKIDGLLPHRINKPNVNPKWLHINGLPPIKQIEAYYNHSDPCSLALSEQGVHVRGLLPDPGLVRRPTFHKLNPYEYDPRKWHLYKFNNPIQMAVCKQGVFVLLNTGAIHRIDRNGNIDLIKNLPAPAQQIITNKRQLIVLLNDGTIWAYGANLVGKEITRWGVLKDECTHAWTRTGSSATWMQLPIETPGTILKIDVSRLSIFLYTTEGVYYCDNLGLKGNAIKRLPLPPSLQLLEKAASSLGSENSEPKEPTPSSRCLIS